MSVSPDTLVEHLVALLFVSDRPLAVQTAAAVLEVSPDHLEQAIALLQADPPRGLILQRNNGHIQLATAPGSARYVQRLLGLPSHARLSGPALEVLAIVAYRQPVTRMEIEAIRGVNSDRVLATLQARGLIEEVGRGETVGRPVLFGTTLAFLEMMGLSSLEELPPLEGHGAASAV